MRLIDKDALIEEAESGGWDVDIKELQMILKYVPTIDAVPVVHGKWIVEIVNNFTYGCNCSVCGGYEMYKAKFCKDCGALMEDKP